MTSVLVSAQGAPRCRAEPAFVPRYRGIHWRRRRFVIRYSLLAPGPTFFALFPSSSLLSRHSPRVASFHRPRDSRLRFIRAATCNVRRTRPYLSHAAADRERCIQRRVSARGIRPARCLIMVILSRRCKLRARSRARQPGERIAFASKRSAQTDYCDNCETIARASGSAM